MAAVPWNPVFDDHCPNPFTCPLGRVQRAGGERPGDRMRAVRARRAAVTNARRHAGDGSFTPADCPAGDPRRLARRTAAQRRRSLSGSELGRGARSGRRRTDAGARHLRRHRYFRRLLRLVVGGTTASRAHIGTSLPVSRRRLRRSDRKLQLGRGAVSAAPCDRHLPAGDRPRDRLELGGQAHPAGDRIRRIAPREQPGDVRRHRLARAGIMARPGQSFRHRIRGDQPQSLGCTRVSQCRVARDPSEHRHRADAGARPYAAGRTAARRRISGSLLHRLRDAAPLSAGRATMQRPRMRTGPRQSAASMRTAFAISRGARPTPAA